MQAPVHNNLHAKDTIQITDAIKQLLDTVMSKQTFCSLARIWSISDVAPLLEFRAAGWLDTRWILNRLDKFLNESSWWECCGRAHQFLLYLHWL